MKNIKKKLMCLMFMLLMCFAFSFTIFADEGEGVESSEGTVTESTNEGEKEIKDSSKGLLESMLKEIFKSPVSKSDTEEATSIFNTYGMLDESVVIIYRALEAIYRSRLYSVFIAIGVVLLTVYFLMDLSTRDILDSTGNRDTIEQIAKPFVKWLICIIFIMNVKWILFMVLGLSQGAYRQVPDTLEITFNETSTFSSPDATAEIDTQGVIDEIYEMIGYEEGGGVLKATLNLGRQLPLMIAFILPWLISLVCDGLLIYVILSRIVNIAIQGAMAPIAMADAYSGNSNGSIRDTRAWGYIKNFASLCFQSVVISLTLIIVNTIILVFISRIFGAIEGAGALANIGWWLNTAVQMTILKMVQVGAVMGSAQKAKELFNA